MVVDDDDDNNNGFIVIINTTEAERNDRFVLCLGRAGGVRSGRVGRAVGGTCTVRLKWG